MFNLVFILAVAAGLGFLRFSSKKETTRHFLILVTAKVASCWGLMRTLFAQGFTLWSWIEHPTFRLRGGHSSLLLFCSLRHFGNLSEIVKNLSFFRFRTFSYDWSHYDRIHLIFFGHLKKFAQWPKKNRLLSCRHPTRANYAGQQLLTHHHPGVHCTTGGRVNEYSSCQRVYFTTMTCYYYCAWAEY